MARNAIKRPDGESTATTPKAPSVMPDAGDTDANIGRAITQVAEPLPAPLTPEAQPEAPAEPTGDARVEKLYRVVSTPEHVQYSGQLVRMRVGKVVSDAAYNLQLLRQQGVRLELLVPV